MPRCAVAADFRAGTSKTASERLVDARCHQQPLAIHALVHDLTAPVDLRQQLPVAG